PYPPIEYLLWPWLPVRGLAMIAGWRGLGKTFLGLGIAYAIAGGGSPGMGWKAQKPRKVLYVDGEMDPADIQGRVVMVEAAARADGNGDPDAAKKNLMILTHADYEFGIPDLGDPDGQGRGRIERLASDLDADVIFLDNLSCLVRTGDENASDSWVVMQN